MPKKLKDHSEAEVHKDLKGFEININEFGEMQSSLPIEKLNEFLDDKSDPEKKHTESNKRKH